ncbi:MAG: hypothetical protein GY929_15945 [Actinomycetia bacterium]|nr:hypothetical protein [Actinomycetes bacterium]
MSSDSPGGRRPRAALREMLLEAGLELLDEEGLGLGAEKITYKRVFDRIQKATGVTITRGSVHDRIWASQREFQLDLLQKAATYDLGDTTNAIGERVLALLAGAGSDDIDLPASIREACRQGATTWVDYEVAPDGWDLWLSVWSMFTLNLERQPTETARLADTVKESIRGIDSSMMAAIGPIARDLGVQPRRSSMGDRTFDETVEVLVRFANAIAEGTALRRRLDPGLVDGFDLPTGPDGELQEWTLGGLGAWLMTQFCFDL